MFFRVLYPQRVSHMGAAGPVLTTASAEEASSSSQALEAIKPRSAVVMEFTILFRNDCDGLTLTDQRVTPAHRPQSILLLANYCQIRVNNTWRPFSGWSLFYWETLNRHMRIHFFASWPTYIHLSWHSETIAAGSYCCLVWVWICLPLFRNQCLDLRCQYQLA